METRMPVNTKDRQSLDESRSIIRRKKFLTLIYEEWYRLFTENLPDTPGAVLEIGSGGGFLGEILPDCITSDCVYLPWIDTVVNGAALPFKTRSLRAIICTDVLHHLADPGKFMSEVDRCLNRNGALMLVEPWVTAWSSFVYSRFHHEPFDPRAALWKNPVAGPLAGANGALAWIMFERDRGTFEQLFPGLRVALVRPFMPLRYLLSGGIGKTGFAPAATFNFWKHLERLLSPFNKHLAMFAYITLVKR